MKQHELILRKMFQGTAGSEVKTGVAVEGTDRKKGKYDDGDGKDEKCDYVPCKDDLEEGVFDRFNRFKRKKKAAPKDDGAGGLITAYEARLEKNADVATIKAYEAGGETVNKIHQALVRMSDAGMKINPLTGAPADQKDEKKFKNFVLKTYPMLRAAEPAKPGRFTAGIAKDDPFGDKDKEVK
jgi:hypothetical protein